MNIAILGYDVEGKASYAYIEERFRGQEYTVTICDQNEELAIPKEAGAQLGKEYLSDLGRFDLIMRTPGIHPNQILEHNPPEVLAKVTTGTNEFFRVCPTKNIIGITGTKGKGTTTTLIAKMLEAAGKRVLVGGNIGTAMLGLLKHDIRPDDWVVLEMSNFQLIDFQYAPHIATCLMVVPEHMNWHAGFEEYIAAKANICKRQTADDMVVYYAENDISQRIASSSKGSKIPYFAAPGAEVRDDAIWIDNTEICKADQVKLLGKHNWQNACAAVTTVWQVTHDAEAVASVLKTFTGLPHRLEYIREVDGVAYYDDSFSTTPETAQVAVETFKEPKVIILGGASKGSSYEALAKTIRANDVRSVVVIGETSSDIRVALQAQGFHDIVDGGMEIHDILATARAQAKPGDVVLLSPGCASFDMFANYKDRGEKFTESVRELA